MNKESCEEGDECGLEMTMIHMRGNLVEADALSRRCSGRRWEDSERV